MKVSIVVPIFNVEKYLKQCIESLVSQTYDNIEIILVDDGSTDSSGEICDRYAQSDMRIIVLHDLNGGLSEARRRGINKASGEYLTIVDGDDWVDQDTIEKCIRVIADNQGLDCLIFSYIREYPNRSLEAHVMSESIIMDEEETERKVYRRLFGLLGDEMKHPERLESMGSCCMKLYRREVALQGRFFDVKEVGSSEDILFNMYALHNCHKVAYIDEPMYHYRKTGESISSSYRPLLTVQWRHLFGIMGDIVEEKSLDETYTQALHNRIALSILGIGMNEMTGRMKTGSPARKRINEYISDELYQSAVRRAELKQLPIPWKCLLWFAKKKLARLLCLELWAIDKVKKLF